MLILFFIYIGYIALAKAASNKPAFHDRCAILAIVGFINIPIIKFSVNFWNSLHQPASIFRVGGPKIHSSMLVPLLIMSGFCLTYYISTLIKKIKLEIVERKIQRVYIRMQN